MNYQLLRVGMDGRISEVLIADAPDDQAARVRAQGFGHHQPVEVWRGSRQIVAVQPTAARSRPVPELWS